MLKRKWLRVILIGIATVVGALVLNANMLFPWQWSAKENKKAALEYIAEHFPTAEIIDVDYKSMILNYMAISIDTFYLELDGIEFSIFTQSGKVQRDTYYEAKAEKYIRENFIDDFMSERNLSPNIEVSFVSPPGHYGTLGEDVLGDIHRFKGSVTVMIKQDNIDGVSTPKELGWFYDFYKYWMDKCDIPRCTVYIYYRQNNEFSTNASSYRIWFEKGEKTFSSEYDFYKHFIA